MPNWCENVVTFTHSDPAMLARITTAADKLFNEFFPCPPELLDTISGFVSGDEAQAALEAKQKSNMAKYSHADWYSWCLEYWGCKWDVEASVEPSGDDSLVVTFSSPWSPPIAFYESMETIGFTVDAKFYECGMSFCGRYSSELGFESFQIDGDSDWVVDNIPHDIDEEFNISVNMSEWEHEEVEADAADDEKYDDDDEKNA